MLRRARSSASMAWATRRPRAAEISAISVSAAWRSTASARTLAMALRKAASSALKWSGHSDIAPSTPNGCVGPSMTTIATLRALGHEAVLAVDLQERNLELARQLGATTTISARQEDLAAAIVAGAGGPVAAIVDFVNNSTTAPAAFAALRKGGTMVQVGLFGGELVIPTALLTLKIITIRGSFVGSLGELEELVGLARRGALPHLPIIDGELSATAVQDALDRLAAGGVPGRIVLSA